MSSRTQIVETNTERAARLFREAALLEEAGDLRKACKLLLEAATLGDSGAQLNLGNYYASGMGTRRNLATAERWYKKAFKSGERCGASNLAIGKRNAGNMRAAILWFKKAIALDDGDAAVELAKLYATRNQVKLAISTLQRSLTFSRSDLSEDGREEAEALLAQLISKGTTK